MPASNYEVLLKAYDEVNALTKHEDQKAERALTALAFISVAGATLFAATFVASGWKELSPGYLQAAYVFFLIFLSLAVGGTMLVLYAIFPRFKIPAEWGGGAGRKELPPRSIFFAIEIAKQSRDSWQEYWKSVTPDQLESVAISNLAYETHLIAEKIIEKVRPLRWGFTFYLLSLVPLVLSVLLLVLAVYN